MKQIYFFNRRNLFFSWVVFLLCNMVVLAQNFTSGNLGYEIISSIPPLQVKVVNPINPGAGQFVGDVVIPSTVEYDGNIYNVTEIGSNTFGYSSGLTSVTVPASVKSIGGAAFEQCTSLVTVNLASGLESISNGAFTGCTALQTITIPNTVTFLDTGVFNGCFSLTSATLSSKLTSLSDGLLANCPALKSIILPSGLTSIGGGVFSGCSALTSITVPEGVTSIGSYAFANCSMVETVKLPSTLTSIGDGAFMYLDAATSFTCDAVTPPSLGQNVFAYAWPMGCYLYVPSQSETTYFNAAQWKSFMKGTLATHNPLENKLIIYPNPAKDSVSLRNLKKGVEVSIYTISGNLVFKKVASENNITVNTTAFENGVYVVNAGGNISKLIISK